MNILVLDYGTTSMRGILFNSKGMMIRQVDYKTPCLYLREGVVEQNPDVWISGTQYVISSILSEHSISAVTITAFRSSIIPVDRNGNALSNCVMWQDTRNNKICGEVKKYNTLFKEKSGSEINTVFSGSRISWMKRNDNTQDAYKYLTVAEYILYHLTGKYKIDFTYGSRSNLMNLSKYQWDKELCEILDVHLNELSELVPPGSTVGYINKNATQLFGLKKGIPVITSGGDQQCGAVGLGVINNDSVEVNSGTGSFVIAQCNDIPRGDYSAICNASAIPGRYILEYNILTSSAAFDWICKMFSPENKEIDFDAISKLIKDVPCGSNGVFCVPNFSGCGTRNWQPNAKAIFGGLTLHSTMADMVKSVLEGIAIEINKNLIDLSHYVPKFKSVSISGGLTRSNIFNQIQADVYQKTIVAINNTQATALGAFVIAAKELRIFSDYKVAYEASTSFFKREKIIPNIDNKLQYQELGKITEKIFTAMLDAGK